MGHVHTYRARCSWEGSTGVGYEHYDRRHTLGAPPAEATIEAASDPAFLGDAELLNPEQLLVMAASSCQLLSFLAVAARARVDVVAYEDDAMATMPEDDKPVRIERIDLRPRITVRRGPTIDKIERLVALAHQECYIANSLRSPVDVSATIEFIE
jgi:organic hydroperoxide reductase OsmC/OhrA